MAFHSIVCLALCAAVAVATAGASGAETATTTVMLTTATSSPMATCDANLRRLFQEISRFEELCGEPSNQVACSQTCKEVLQAPLQSCKPTEQVPTALEEPDQLVDVQLLVNELSSSLPVACSAWFQPLLDGWQATTTTTITITTTTQTSTLTTLTSEILTDFLEETTATTTTTITMTTTTQTSTLTTLTSEVLKEVTATTTTTITITTTTQTSTLTTLTSEVPEQAPATTTMTITITSLTPTPELPAPRSESTTSATTSQMAATATIDPTITVSTIMSTTATTVTTATSLTSTSTATHTAIRASVVRTGALMRVDNPEEFVADHAVRMSLTNSYARLAGVAPSQCELLLFVVQQGRTSLRRLSGQAGQVEVSVVITLVSSPEEPEAADDAAVKLNNLDASSLASQFQSDLTDAGVPTVIVIEAVETAFVEEITLIATTVTETVTATAASTTMTTRKLGAATASFASVRSASKVVMAALASVFLFSL